jgi:hypothetical protein
MTKMSGTLCYAGHEPSTGIEWMVRRHGGGRTGNAVWTLYRADAEYSIHYTPRSAYTAYAAHVPYVNDIEASMGR